MDVMTGRMVETRWTFEAWPPNAPRRPRRAWYASRCGSTTVARRPCRALAGLWHWAIAA